MAEAKFRCIKLANNLAGGNGKKFISCLASQPASQPASSSSSWYLCSSLIRRVVCPAGLHTLSLGSLDLTYWINVS